MGVCEEAVLGGHGRNEDQIAHRYLPDSEDPSGWALRCADSDHGRLAHRSEGMGGWLSMVRPSDSGAARAVALIAVVLVLLWAVGGVAGCHPRPLSHSGQVVLDGESLVAQPFRLSGGSTSVDGAALGAFTDLSDQRNRTLRIAGSVGDMAVIHVVRVLVDEGADVGDLGTRAISAEILRDGDALRVMRARPFDGPSVDMPEPHAEWTPPAGKATFAPGRPNGANSPWLVIEGRAVVVRGTFSRANSTKLTYADGWAEIAGVWALDNVDGLAMCHVVPLLLDASTTFDGPGPPEGSSVVVAGVLDGGVVRARSVEATAGPTCSASSWW